MVQLSATRCSCIVILWVSLVSFAAITLLCCFSTSVYCCCCLFRYWLGPETFGYTLVFRWLPSSTVWTDLLLASPSDALCLILYTWTVLLYFCCKFHILPRFECLSIIIVIFVWLLSSSLINVLSCYFTDSDSCIVGHVTNIILYLIHGLTIYCTVDWFLQYLHSIVCVYLTEHHALTAYWGVDV
jgi:hypothetical protein